MISSDQCSHHGLAHGLKRRTFIRQTHPNSTTSTTFAVTRLIAWRFCTYSARVGQQTKRFADSLRLRSERDIYGVRAKNQRLVVVWKGLLVQLPNRTRSFDKGLNIFSGPKARHFPANYIYRQLGSAAAVLCCPDDQQLIRGIHEGRSNAQLLSLGFPLCTRVGLGVWGFT